MKIKFFVLISLIFLNFRAQADRVRCEGLFSSETQIQLTAQKLARFRVELHSAPAAGKDLRLKEFDALFVQFSKAVRDKKLAADLFAQALKEVEQRQDEVLKKKKEADLRDKKQEKDETEVLQEWRFRRVIKNYVKSENTLGHPVLLGVTPDGSKLIAATEAGQLKILDLNTYAEILNSTAPSGEHSGFWTVNQGSKLIHLVGRKKKDQTGGVLKILDLSEIKESPVAYNGEGVWKVALTPDQSHLIALSDDIKIYDVRTGNPVTLPYNHSDHVSDFALSPDGKYLVSFSQANGEVKMMDLQSGLEIPIPIELEPGKFRNAMITPDGSQLIVQVVGGFKAFHFPGMNPVNAVMPQFKNHQIAEPAITPDHKQLILRFKEGIRVFDLATWQELRLPNLNSLRDVIGLKISADSQQIFVTGEGGLTKRFDLNTDLELPLAEKSSIDGTYLIAITPNQNSMITLDVQGHLSIYFRRQQDAEAFDAVFGRGI